MRNGRISIHTDPMIYADDTFRENAHELNAWSCASSV